MYLYSNTLYEISDCCEFITLKCKTNKSKVYAFFVYLPHGINFEMHRNNFVVLYLFVCGIIDVKIYLSRFSL